MFRAYLVLIKKLLTKPWILLEVVYEILSGKEVNFEIENDKAKIYSQKKGEKK